MAQEGTKSPTKVGPLESYPMIQLRLLKQEETAIVHFRLSEITSASSDCYTQQNYPL